jgi:hypothetical protein
VIVIIMYISNIVLTNVSGFVTLAWEK